ncbi:MAG: hypothetical protein KTR31_10380 [Myxococcales bacterium]|nr:hypothetical protein [Myxococcales bacterium]
MVRPLSIALFLTGCLERPTTEDSARGPDTQVAEDLGVRSASWWRHPKWPQLVFAQARFDEPPDDAEFLLDRGSYRADWGPGLLPSFLVQGWSAPIEGVLRDAVDAEFASLSIELLPEDPTPFPYIWHSVPRQTPYGAPEADLTLHWSHDANDVYVDAFFGEQAATVPPGVRAAVGDHGEVDTFEPVTQLSTWLVADGEPGLDLVRDDAVFAFDAMGPPQQEVGCITTYGDAAVVDVELLGFEDRYGASPLKVEIATLGGRELLEPTPGELVASRPRFTAVIAPADRREDSPPPPLVLTAQTSDGPVQVELEVPHVLDPSRPPGMAAWPLRGVDVEGDGEKDLVVEVVAWGTQVLVSVENLGLAGTLQTVHVKEDPDRVATLSEVGSSHVFRLSAGARVGTLGLRATLEDGSEVPVHCVTTLPSVD